MLDIGSLFCMIALVAVGIGLLSGVVIALIKLGVIFQKASEAPYQDTGGSYSIDQGRDVGKEE
jgi:Zn-dependent membrane protease YugP